MLSNSAQSRREGNVGLGCLTVPKHTFALCCNIYQVLDQELEGSYVLIAPVKTCIRMYWAHIRKISKVSPRIESEMIEP